MFNRSFLEQILKWQGYPLNKASEELAYVSRLQGSSFAGWQEEKKWEIFKFHLNNNPFYKSSILKNKEVQHWTDVPVMSKADYQGNIQDKLSGPFKRRKIYLANTSGSSGHPFFYAKDKYAHALTWCLIKERYASVGISLNDLQGRFYGIPLEKKGYAQESIKDFLMNRIRFPVFDLSDSKLKDIQHKIERKGVGYLYGYTSAVVLFARYLIRNEIILGERCPVLKACIVTSEVCTPEDIDLLQRGLGVKIINEYGSSELGIMAFGKDNGELIGSDELIFFETITNSNGDQELLCTSLFNKAFPIIRYRIGDLVDMKKKDGRTFFNRIEGRTNDLVRLPSGKVSAGLTFYYVSRSILESSGVLKEFIIRQTALNQFEFDIVSDRKLSIQEETLIREKTFLYLEPNLEIRFNYCNAITRPASGKIKHFYSQLQ